MQRVKIFFYILFCIVVQGKGQDYFSYGNSNYSGVLQLIANPAAAAGNKVKLDILPLGFEASFNNSWAAVKKEALGFPKLPGSWRNYTPNLPGNIYKNFVWNGGEYSKEMLFEQRLLLPSALVRIDSRNSIAFTSCMRQVGNITGISQPLANLFEKEFDLSVLQNNPVQNKDFLAIRMSWIEYGITYARLLVDKNSHRLKAGITPKILQGLESSYFFLRDLNFLFSNKDTLSYLEADFTVAHSAKAATALDIAGNVKEKFRHAAQLAPGLDIGLIYEWHPAIAASSGKDVPAEKKSNGHSTQYKIKAGLALVDVGRIRFRKEINYYEMKISLRQSDIIRYISSENVRMIDSLLHNDFPANTGEDNFTVLMPTAVNTQLDYSINKSFFVNLNSRLTGFYNHSIYKVRNYSTVCLAPRYESYWIDASLLLTWNALSAKRSQAFTPGINVRLGPLTIGSSDLSFLFNENLSSLNFYTMLRIPILFKEKVNRQPTKS